MRISCQNCRSLTHSIISILTYNLFLHDQLFYHDLIYDDFIFCFFCYGMHMHVQSSSRFIFNQKRMKIKEEIDNKYRPKPQLYYKKKKCLMSLKIRIPLILSWSNLLLSKNTCGWLIINIKNDEIKSYLYTMT